MRSVKDIEHELVSRLKAGDELAFELIFHRTKGKLKGFLKKTLPYDEDAESVMQEIYLKLWLNRKSVKTEKKFETYLYAITRNMVIDILRKRLQRNNYLEELYSQLNGREENSLDTLATVEYSELENKIFDLIEQLPERRQLIFRLNRLEGNTYKQIAEKLGISENTVDTQMRQALAFLKTELKHILTIMLLFYLHN